MRDGRDDERWKLEENVGDRTHKIATSVPCALYSPNGFIVMPVCCWRPGKCIRCRYFFASTNYVMFQRALAFVHKQATEFALILLVVSVKVCSIFSQI